MHICPTESWQIKTPFDNFEERVDESERAIRRSQDMFAEFLIKQHLYLERLGPVNFSKLYNSHDLRNVYYDSNFDFDARKEIVKTNENQPFWDPKSSG